ncbi:rhomboid family intramembrane serine protease [Cellulophaga sp. E16_2]|uniref:Peptidase S54, rhomboid domain protein n=1 Tax=Cellulophaga algicola (strain DSM 14237 / IC166 / ACAM 630) TaxID=688270 RepID=E6XC46_CELAD|nr:MULTISPECIES: rhomboid family intramembrane serine protease [Cellulophaga]ADV50051.1 Peptidase S54, rhomboid domain protein [Cellulophaga algicola DSM 14237]MBO0592426.1 rhomboid family intramembrane serine protease [Cellulophaga sp. E16_2]
MAVDLKYQFARLNIAEKLIVVNVVIFIITRLVAVLFSIEPGVIVHWFELPKDFGTFILQPWSIVTYAFFHGDFGHIFWNMVMLYFTGRIFMNLFGERKFVNVYFLGAIFGGLLFILSYNIFPALIGLNNSLIGASAAVMAVLIFVCTYTPNQEVRVILFNVKLWHVGVVFVLIDLFFIGGGVNIGGRLSHLGGAFIGYFYASQLTQGRDIGSGFSKMLDSIQNLFKKEKKAPLKTVYRKPTSNVKNTVVSDQVKHQRQIDIILDKISKSGYESLSKAEKDFLFKAGKE